MSGAHSSQAVEENSAPPDPAPRQLPAADPRREPDELMEAVRARIVADSERMRIERLLASTSVELERVSRELAWIENSIVRRLLRRAKRFETAYGVARKLAQAVGNARPSRWRPRKAREPSSEERASSLPFGGIALRASYESPEAFVHARPAVVGVCHPHWRGIREATYSMCEAVLEIPDVQGSEHARAIGGLLAEAGTRCVVLQGVPPGAERLAVTLRRAHPGMRLLHVFHGSAAQHTIMRDESELLNHMLELSRCGVLDGVGFVKPGMAEALRACGYHAFPLFNKVRPVVPAPKAHAPRSDRLDIGVFVPNLWVKNINTQVLAALSVPNSVVHVTEMPGAEYLKAFEDRIVVEGMLPHDRFVSRLGAMDVNLYVSLSECFPMTVIESLERGVPCLTSHTSPIFDDDPELFEALVVTSHDDPGAIARKLKRAVDARAIIVERAHAHLSQLNARADALWAEFVDG